MADSNGKNEMSNMSPEERQGFQRRQALFINTFMKAVGSYVSNISLSRKEWMQRSEGDSRRDIYEECGYYKGEWSPERYQKTYEDNPIAARVNDVLPEGCWQTQPEVYETENPAETTEFELAFNSMCRNLLGRKSRFQAQRGNPLWEFCHRADRLCGIGRYGVILLGIDDGKSLHEPAKGIEEQNSNPLPVGDSGQNPSQPGNPSKFRVYSLKTNARKAIKNAPLSVKDPKELATQALSGEENGYTKLLYVRVFPETLAKITKVENNPSSPRFKQPVEYELTLDEGIGNSPVNSVSSGTVKVHWSRCIHVADNLDSSEVYGVPRMKQVRHRLEDVDKLYGGSAEMYWKGAFPGLSFETQPGLGGEVEMDIDSIKDEAENYMEGLKRYLATVGIKVNSLAPQVVDPSPQIDKQIEAICIEIDVPKRKFIGSEQGELAGSQDDSTYKEKLKSRQLRFITPKIIIPLVDRCIDLYILPEPEVYDVFWPDMMSQSTLDKSKVAVSRTQALVQYIQGNVQQLMTISDYLVSVVGFTEAEALKFIENIKARPEEDLIETPEQASMKMDVTSSKAQDAEEQVRTKGKGREEQKRQAESGTRFEGQDN